MQVMPGVQAATAVATEARLLAPVWLKFSASEEAKLIVVLLGKPVISPTAAAVCTELVPWAVLPLPGVLTVNSSRSPKLRPPGARMFVGRPAVRTVAGPTVAWVPLGKVNAKLVRGKL